MSDQAAPEPDSDADRPDTGPDADEHPNASAADLLRIAEVLGRMTEETLEKRPTEGFQPLVAVLACSERGGPWEVAILSDADGGDRPGEPVGAWKERLMTGIGQKIFELRKLPLAAVLASEAWLSRQEPDHQAVMPAGDDPLRYEVIVLAGTTINHSASCLGMMTITRTPENIIRPGKFQKIENTTGHSETFIVDRLFEAYVVAATAWLADRAAARARGEDPDA